LLWAEQSLCTLVYIKDYSLETKTKTVRLTDWSHIDLVIKSILRSRHCIRCPSWLHDKLMLRPGLHGKLLCVRAAHDCWIFFEGQT